jgi:hypothetical protein
VQAHVNWEILELGNWEIYFVLFDRAVLLAAVKIAVNCRDSDNKGSTFSFDAFPVSGIISNQKVVSSASSSTTPILATNSAWLLALQVAR